MKKVIILALVCFLGLTQMNAQVSFRPGVKAGLNSSHFTQTNNTNEKFTSKTDYYVGVFGALKASKIYTLQPELVYTRQGSGREFIEDNVRKSETLNVSYLSLTVANKFTFNKFNFQLGSAFDVKINDTDKELIASTNNNGGYYDYNYNSFNGVDLAFFLGAGFDFTKNFGIEARVKKGIIPVNDDWDYTNVVFQVGATYTFDVK
jgi:hypothetical protein